MTTTAKAGSLAALKVEISRSSGGYASVSAKDTAKLVRYWLGREFPGVKFQVKTSRYAGGAAIDVFWTDGPGVAQVEQVVQPFAGSGFDGMQDLKTSNEAWLFPDGSAQRHVSGLGQWGGAIVRDGSGVKLTEAEVHGYMAGLKLALHGATTRVGYDETSDAFKLGQADADLLTREGAVLVSFHADYIMTHRELSPQARGELERAVVFLAGEAGEFDGNRRYDLGVNGLPGGSEEYGHTLVYRLSRLDDPAQLDGWMAEEAERRAIVGARLWNEQARLAGNQEARGEQRAALGLVGYYVTVKDGNQWGALLGPYDTREGAEADVPEGKRLAESVNDRAIWYGYGVTRVTAKPGRDLEPGKLEKLPARQMALAFPEAARIGVAA